jgi:hypothetical protein
MGLDEVAWRYLEVAFGRPDLQRRLGSSSLEPSS